MRRQPAACAWDLSGAVGLRSSTPFCATNSARLPVVAAGPPNPRSSGARISRPQLPKILSPILRSSLHSRIIKGRIGSVAFAPALSFCRVARGFRCCGHWSAHPSFKRQRTQAARCGPPAGPYFHSSSSGRSRIMLVTESNCTVDHTPGSASIFCSSSTCLACYIALELAVP